MIKTLITFIICLIAFCVNLLCIIGKLDIIYVTYGIMAVVLSTSLISLTKTTSPIQPPSTPKKTIYQILYFGVVIGWCLTMFLAYMFYYNR